MPSVKRKRATHDENAPQRATLAAPRRKRSKNGVLKSMAEMPLDVVEEVCINHLTTILTTDTARQILGHLDPGALLNLARAIKVFHEIIMDKGNARLWVRSRQNVQGLPDCPPHLSEQSYANLCFSKGCYGCNKSKTSKIIWTASARYCDDCTNGHMPGVSLFFSNEDNQMYARYEKLLPTFRIHCRLSFHLPDLWAMHSAWERLSDDDGSRSKFLAEQKDNMDARHQHAKACEKWRKTIDATRAEELRITRDQRFSFIKARLCELGWSESLLASADKKLRSLQQVRSSTPLDNKGWALIRKRVEDVMIDIDLSHNLPARIKKFAKIFGDVKAENLDDVHIRWWPGTVDIILMEGTPYRDRLSNGDHWPPTGDALAALKTEVLRDVKTWLDKQKKVLGDFVLTESDDDRERFPIGTEPADLVSCMLVCCICSNTVCFPDILVHACFRGCRRTMKRDAFEQELQRRTDMLEKNILETLGYFPWSLQGYSKDTSAPRSLAVKLRPLDTRECFVNCVLTCGKDPWRMTWRDMNDGSFVFCRKESEGRFTAMDWRLAALDCVSQTQEWVNDPLIVSEYWRKHSRPELRFVKNVKEWRRTFLKGKHDPRMF
ncbi:hypothetical protein EVJ58_g7754 [Rhodofomes roseus]|uniref:F-box domain-containing protein n=1 Tax=Rhodofomes roseus TaxID=34475 RepID=A0A4Y9Y5Z7_9APHY|nr:hypothetical protein EVJ58_g7754 [Rhodofomes roseus]